jgi:small subunit ribosomal protein S17
MSRKRFVGEVVSDKMKLTVVVEVTRLVKHPRYEKRVRKTKRFKAENSLGAKVGDKVVIEETRPLSKEKRWMVVEVVTSR